METMECAIKLIQIMRDMENLKVFSDSVKLSKTEFRLLREVVVEREKGNDIISSELARRLGITRSAVSQLVGKLEAQGIVVRAAAPVDRKIAYIRLSERAVATLEAQRRRVMEVISRAVEELGEERVNGFFAAYDEFIAAIKKAHREVLAETKK